MQRALAILFLGLAVLGGTATTATALRADTVQAYGGEGTGPCRGKVPGPCPW
jgi:hypothetical protein